MAKGPKLTDSVVLLISSIYQEHPDWVVKRITYELHERLKTKSPGESAVRKELVKIKGHLKENNPGDEPWSIAKIAVQPHIISPEALPTVLEVQRLVKEPRRPFQIVLLARKGFNQPTAFTVRDAKWVVLFSAFVPRYLPDTGLLAAVALTCSFFEHLYYSAELSFDTTAIEEMLTILTLKPDDKQPATYTKDDWDEHWIRFEKYFVDTINRLMKIKRREQQ